MSTVPLSPASTMPSSIVTTVMSTPVVSSTITPTSGMYVYRVYSMLCITSQGLRARISFSTSESTYASTSASLSSVEQISTVSAEQVSTVSDNVRFGIYCWYTVIVKYI